MLYNASYDFCIIITAPYLGVYFDYGKQIVILLQTVTLIDMIIY